MNERATPRGPAWAQLARHVGERLLASIRLGARAVWRGGVSFIDNDDFTFASSIAYYALLSLFPALLLAFSVLGRVTADDADRAKLLQFTLQYFPEQSTVLAGQLESLPQASLGLGIAGMILITWTALRVFRAISLAVNHAWGLRESTGYLRHQVVAFVMLLAAGLLLLLAFGLVSATRVMQASWFVTILEQMPGLAILTGLTFRFIATLLLIIVVGLVFYFVPNTEIRLADVWVGAILTGVLWRVALEGFSWYASDPSRLSIHGSITTVVAFLLWVHLEASILLYGAEFTAAYTSLRRLPQEPSLATLAPGG